jgi:hypothetical protein
MSFQEETPLEDVLKYIKQATTSAPDFPAGIPIYVDPVGLQEAEKSMTSTIRFIDLEGIPLRRTLQLLLKQLNLIYFVEDGMLCITSEEYSEGKLGPTMLKPAPLEEKVEKAERGELTLNEMKELVEILKTREEVRAVGNPHTEGGGAIIGGGSGGRATPGSEDARLNKELIELLVKETRELVDALNAAKQAKKPPEVKSAGQ